MKYYVTLKHCKVADLKEWNTKEFFDMTLKYCLNKIAIVRDHYEEYGRYELWLEDEQKWCGAYFKNRFHFFKSIGEMKRFLRKARDKQ